MLIVSKIKTKLDASAQNAKFHTVDYQYSSVRHDQMKYWRLKNEVVYNTAIWRSQTKIFLPKKFFSTQRQNFLYLTKKEISKR